MKQSKKCEKHFVLSAFMTMSNGDQLCRYCGINYFDVPIDERKWEEELQEYPSLFDTYAETKI